MALNLSDINNNPELKEFLVNEEIKTQIQAQIRKLNTLCFERCVEKPGSSDDEQTFLLIRLPKETIEQVKLKKEAEKDGEGGGAGGLTKVGSVFVYDNEQPEFQDIQSNKIYTLMRNSPTKSSNHGTSGSQKRDVDHIVANEESDLFKISLQRDEAVHLGKVKFSTLLAVPKVDEKDVSTVFG